MPNFCAAPNCTRKSTQSDLAFFRFPRDPGRCQKWVENCRRADLEDKTPDQLNKHYRLCAQHFEDAMVCRSSPYRTVLRENAIPTIFDLTSHLGNPGRRRKRIKELTEEEIRMLKERKLDAVVPEQDNHQNNDEDIQIVEVDQSDDGSALTAEEKEHRDYIRSLFEIVLLMGKQNISLKGRNCKAPEGIYTPDNFQALLEYRINSGDDVLRRRFEMLAVNQEYFSRPQQEQLLEICENCIREEALRHVWNGQFFSILCEDAVGLAGGEHLPIFVRHIDDASNLREEFVGFLPCDADADDLAARFLSTLTEKWGFNMEYCRGQAYVCSAKLYSKMKAVASRVLQKYPQATCTLSSSCALNIWLAKSAPVAAVSAALGILDDVYLFFKNSSLLQQELENTIAALFADNGDNGSELKELLKSEWVTRHDAFEVAVALLQSLVFCLDKISCVNPLEWDSGLSSRAFTLSSALVDFDFLVTVVILKNALSYTRAFGKNLQGSMSDVFSAANSLTAVLHTLNEVMDNIEVYHEFWFEEATLLAAKLDIPIKLPGRHRRAQYSDLHPDLTAEAFYKDALTVPTVQHVIKALKDIFSEQHLKALKCLSLVPSVMGHLKFSVNEEHHTDLYKCDLPNPDTLSAELHCWRVKWKHRGKDVELSSTIFESLQLPDMKFFPNVQVFLKILGVLPIVNHESEKSDTCRKRLKLYLDNTPQEQRSNHLVLLNVNYDSKHDLDFMVDSYIRIVDHKDKSDSLSKCTDIADEV
ncbi:52 kDa repressor of the inhibitor of the protein kinase [Gastrophryne carolinensis]